MQDKYRFYLGSMLVIGIMVFGACVALGKVEEKTSYGLSPILIMLGKVVLDFSVWAFPNNTPNKPDKDNTDPPKPL